MPQKKRGQTPVEEAVARILNALDVPEKTEEIPLLQALGRVAAGDVCARVAQPPLTARRWTAMPCGRRTLPPQARKRPLPCPSAGISVPAATPAGRWPRARLPAS